MPLRACGPRSANLRPDPATKSLTVLDTSTSPDAGRRMHRDAGDVLAHVFDLPRVQPGPHFDSQPQHRLRDGTRAPDGPGRTIEGRKEPVAGRADLSAPKPF